MNNSVFFYLAQNTFPHLSICLAEGLKELGIPFDANIDYWYISSNEETLFKNDINITPDDCSMVVVDTGWFAMYACFPENLFHSHRQYITIHLNDEDGPVNWKSNFEPFDIILKTHCNRWSLLPNHIKPWAFGLSKRILQASVPIPEFQQRNKNLLVNYRHNQNALKVFGLYLQIETGQLQVEQGLLILDSPLRSIIKEHFLQKIATIFPINEQYE